MPIIALNQSLNEPLTHCTRRRNRSDWYALYQINPVMNHTTRLAIQLSSVMSFGYQFSLSA